MIRDLVQTEVRSALASLMGSSTPKRGRKRGKWRPGGPGRPPKAVADKAAPRRRKRKAG
jgi:hypothetical protein